MITADSAPPVALIWGGVAVVAAGVGYYIYGGSSSPSVDQAKGKASEYQGKAEGMVNQVEGKAKGLVDQASGKVRWAFVPRG